jgi:putative glutamine amidotransferase
MSADLACIEAVQGAGGEVRLLPLRLPHAEEDAIEMVLQAVLPFDGLLLAGSDSDVDPRLYGQVPHPQTARPEPLIDWWAMLMALVARETLTPLFGICGGAERLNVAFGGTLYQHIAGHRAGEITADNWMIKALELDPEKLAVCIRGGTLSVSGDYLPDGKLGEDISCMHHQAPDILAPGLLVWGKSGSIVEGFGYAGPRPWFALATLFHAEVMARHQNPLSHTLFESFLLACRAYAASLRDELKSTRMRDRMLRRLYADPLVQRFLQGPLVLEMEEACSPE